MSSSCSSTFSALRALFARRKFARRKTHTLTIVSICSTIIYLSVYNRAVIQDFFADAGSVDDYQYKRGNDVEKNEAAIAAEKSSWSYRRRQDTPETSLRKLAPELFHSLPGPFTPKLKNPCWDMRKKPRQCLPYFYLIGMPKCGTTDLWNKLMGHPHVVNTGKEPHWWSRARIAQLNRTHGKLNPDPVSYYTRYATAINNYSAARKLNISKVIVGDGSASTLWDNQHWKLFYPNITLGPPHINGELIVSVQPNVRVIAILRDPTSRLYSDYLFFNTHTTLSPIHFHERVKETIGKFQECVLNLDLRTCTYNTSSIQKLVRIEVGLYSVYIGDWLSFFPKRQLKVIRTEDWRENCLKALVELYAFLRLEKMNLADVFRICKDEAQNTRSPEKQNLGPMLPQTKQLLDDFYAPYNRELARMLGDDRFLWKDRGSSEESVP